MPSFAVTRDVKTNNPNDAFQETLSQLPDLGYIVWKTRPLAWLIIANREHPDGKVNATISFRPGDGVVLSISLSCETMEEAALRAIGEELADALDTLVASGS